jgi:hypothetical protein
MRYLAGEPDAPLEPFDLAAIDDVRAVLTDEAIWIEPDPGLQDRVACLIADAAIASAMGGRRRLQ